MEKNLEILTILQEECGELIVAISKMKRFGLSPENLVRFNQEIADVLCMLDIAQQHGISSMDNIEELINNKREKLKVYSNIYV